MDGVETVDVSWLHHSHRDQALRNKATAPVVEEKTNGDTASTSRRKPSVDKQEKNNGHAKPQQQQQQQQQQGTKNTQREEPRGDNGDNATEKPSDPTKPRNVPSTPVKGSAPRPVPARRNSWISSISSKFSTGNTPPSPGTTRDNVSTSPKPSPTSIKQEVNPFGASFSPKDKDERNTDANNPFTSTSPKNPSFLQSAIRKLSSGASGIGKGPQQTTPCQRRVMNVDTNRDRCKVPELNPGKLKRVAFCVDVEIAGFSSREADETAQPETSGPPRSQPSKSKGKEKNEGKEKENTGEEKEKAGTTNGVGDGPSSPPSPDNAAKVETQTKEPTRKQEKKKRSEEERKERKERRRKQAEANGSIPLQLKADDDDDGSKSSTPGSSRSRAQNHPTTDPVRIYRRCCQLRETPVLKRLVERMTSPSSTLAEAPGTVAVLDLTNFPMTLPDIVTFSDWLAIVPVRKLILENCALTDEAVRSILAGLLSTKTMQQARNSRRSARLAQGSGSIQRPFGIVEKLSLKNNPKIGPEGWRHICLFIHLSRSLKAIDLSGIPFPKKLMRANEPTRGQSPSVDIGTTLSTSLTTRFGGGRLEELLLSECQPSTEDIAKLCDAAISIGLRRLGLASNNLTREGLEHVARYFHSGKCEGLDLGGNDIKDHLDVLLPTINASNQAMALSLADCSLTPASIYPLLQAFPSMPCFRFVDFSHNPQLFASQPDSLSMLRRFLPKMAHMKRIHLADVDMSPDHLIALAEVLPECPSLCHLNILENPKIATLASSTDPASQEEACAVYASLMAAVRVSRTLIAVDIEVPGAESSEVVKALASQIVVYSLRNLGALEDIDGADQSARPTVQIPEVLQHIVGHDAGISANITGDESAPGEDYVIGGTGVVKALGVCLGNVDRHQSESAGGSRPGSGYSTPVSRVSAPVSNTTKKPRDMSKNLLGVARNIQARIQLALVREDRAGNDNNYRRLQFLDHTLQKMIKRFEEEYPECRISAGAEDETSSLDSSEENQEATAAPATLPADVPESAIAEDEETDPFAIRLSRRGSNTSLHSRALTSEEGRLHRIGQNLRRDFLEPSLQSSEQGLSPSGDESHVHALREKLKALKGDEIRSRVESVGADKALQELGSTVEELWIIQQQDQDAFQKFKESQIAAQVNAGLRPASSHGEKESPSE